MQNKYSLTRRKKGHWVDYTQLPASPSLWPISKIPCPSCLRDNYSEQPCRQTGPIKTGAFHICASIYLIFSWVRASAAAKSLQSCLTLCDPPRWQPTRLPHPWDSPGKKTGMGCHFLLQCMKVKSEREVTQSCPTLSDPMDCSLPGSSIHGIFQARVLKWGVVAFSGSLNYLRLNI